MHSGDVPYGVVTTVKVKDPGLRVGKVLRETVLKLLIMGEKTLEGCVTRDADYSPRGDGSPHTWN